MRRQRAEIEQAVASGMKIKLFVNPAPVVQISVLVKIAVINPAFRVLLDADRVADPAQRAVLGAHLQAIDALVVGHHVAGNVVQQGRIVLERARPQLGVDELEIVALVVSGERLPFIRRNDLDCERLADAHESRRIDSQHRGRPAGDLQERIAAVIARPLVGADDEHAEIEQILRVVLHAHSPPPAEIEIDLVAFAQRARGQDGAHGLAVGENAYLVALHVIGVDALGELDARSGGFKIEISRTVGVVDLKLLDVAGEVFPDFERFALRRPGGADRVFDAHAPALARLDHRRRQQLHRALSRKPGRHVPAGPVVDAHRRRVERRARLVGRTVRVNDGDRRADEQQQRERMFTHVGTIVTHPELGFSRRRGKSSLCCSA